MLTLPHEIQLAYIVLKIALRYCCERNCKDTYTQKCIVNYDVMEVSLKRKRKCYKLLVNFLGAVYV